VKKKILRSLLAAACLAVLGYPPAARLVARRRALARLERAPASGCLALGDEALALRLRTLGPLLASWETIGGCGAGGATGTGVKWIGHNTSGGLFLSMIMNNYVVLPAANEGGQGTGGYNNILNLQLGEDFIFDPWRGSWNFAVSVPYLVKHYNTFGNQGAITNAGIGDINLFLSRKVGTDNSTTLTLVGGIPTGTFRASYMGSELTPDQQLGFGRLTGSLLAEHTFDQDWGLILLGGAASYRGGRQTDKYLFVFDHPSNHNYRAPSASLFGYTGFFAGPVVPALGFNLTGYTQQDTRGDFGETLNIPVATGAVHASLEWSNPNLAILAGVYVPFALRGSEWGMSPKQSNIPYLQPWTIALGVSASPF
jgi:hypothetical protein